MKVMNPKPKRYELLRDLPDCKTGTRFDENIADQNGKYWYLNNIGQYREYSKYLVEDYPEWFREIIDPENISDDTFYVRLTIEDFMKLKRFLKTLK